MRRLASALFFTLLLSACGLVLDTSPPDQVRDGGGVTRCSETSDCDDGVFCNGFEECVSGICETIGRPQCGDAVACTTDVCNEHDRACEHVANDALCGSGTVCDPSSGCRTRTPCSDDDACDDGNACTTGESCGDDGFCVFGAPRACPSQGCLAGYCDPSSGECEVERSDAACADDYACTTGECRSDGTCAQRADNAKCDDGASCTEDLCVGVRYGNDTSGCVHKPDDLACRTGSDDACYARVCAPGAAGNNDTTGCALRVPPDACGLDERCNLGTGTCQKLPAAAGTSSMCDDGDPCNGIETLSEDGTKCETTGHCPEPSNACFQSVCVNGTVRSCGFRVNPDEHDACILFPGPPSP